MRILHLSNKPVYPVVDGGCKAMEKLLACLKYSGHSVDHICISTEKHPFYKDEYPIGFNVTNVEISTKTNLIDAFLTWISSDSYNISRFRSSELDKHIANKLSSTKYDLIILDSLYATTSLPMIRSLSDAKVIIRTHNVESDIWFQKSSDQKSSIKRKVYRRLAEALKRYELSTLENVDGILSITENDAERFKALGISSPIRTIPVALDSAYKKDDYSSSVFYHIGSMNWAPNIEAVDYLIDELFPKIKTILPDAHLRIIGSFMPEKYKQLKREGIEISGYVDDLNYVYNSSGIFISPILSGSGVRIKVLEAMSCGVPILTSTLGAQGIKCEKGLITANSTEEFVAKAVELAENEDLRKETGTLAYECIRQEYSTSMISKKIDEFVERI